MKNNFKTEMTFSNPKLATRTRQIYEQTVAAYFAFCRRRNIRKVLTVAALEEFLSTYSAPTTRNLARTGLKSYFKQKYATSPAADRFAVVDTFDKVRPARVERRAVNYLVIEDIMKLVEALSPRISTIAELMFWSGARVSELINIGIDDCKILDTGWSDIRLYGKGRRVRSVFVPTKVLKRAMRIHQGKRFLFETETGKTYGRKQVTDEIRRQARLRCGLHVYSHLLRHSRAMHLLQRDVNLHEIAAFLGHASPQTTLMYYMHGLPDPAKCIEV